jgi:hypothetical protein
MHERTLAQVEALLEESEDLAQILVLVIEKNLELLPNLKWTTSESLSTQEKFRY